MIRWLKWRCLRVFALLMYWRLRIAGVGADEAFDRVMLILRSSRLVVAKDGGDPWKHMGSTGGRTP